MPASARCGDGDDREVAVIAWRPGTGRLRMLVDQYPGAAGGCRVEVRLMLLASAAEQRRFMAFRDGQRSRRDLRTASGIPGRQGG
jgi:hypothetical protein